MIPAVRRTSHLPLILVLTASAAHADGFGFASLEALMRTRDVGTVDELLAALPEGQRRNYALVFDSRSLQGASFENPRVILYGPDARFVLTFNGNAAQHGFRAVETLEFDAAAREFRLRELEFPERPGGAAAVRVSEANPGQCLRCHGNPPRPVWDSFPLWPGAYGERYGVSLSERERAGLERFLAQQASHPRYRYLLEAARYADPRTFRPGAGAQYVASVREPPNAELSADLGNLQFQAIASRLMRQSAFASYRYALLGVADGGCAPLSDFYPETLWRTQREALERFAADTARANVRQAQLKAQRVASGVKTPVPTAANTLLPLRFLAESALGLPTRNWTLALETGTYDFTPPPSATPALRAALLAAIAPGDRALETLSYSATSADGDRYCSYLKRRSRTVLAGPDGTVSDTGAPSAAALAAGHDPAAGGAAVVPPAALQVCGSCHESGPAPLIPFSDPLLLAQQLRVRSAPHGTLYDEIRFRLSAAAGAHRMPLGLNLADDERQRLEAYFAALAVAAN
jgi:cytochrome c553